MNVYQKLLAEILVELKRPDVDPRHVEGYIRLQHPTLGGLSKEEFLQETKIALTCIDATGWSGSETLALSYGLTVKCYEVRSASELHAAFGSTKRAEALSYAKELAERLGVKAFVIGVSS